MSQNRSESFGRVLILLCALLVAGPSFAVVTNVATVAQLRAAIADKKKVPNESTIVLKASAKHYDLSLDGLGPIKITRSLTLKGGTDNPRDTVLSGGGVTNVLYVNAANALATGLTLTNGVPYLVDNRKWYFGGGVYVYGVTAVVSNCVVTGCHFDTRTDYQTGSVLSEMAYLGGVGVYVSGSGLITHSLVENCWVYNDVKAKVAATGGGLFLSGRAWQSTVPSRAICCEVRNCSTETRSLGGGTGALAGGGMHVADGGRAEHCLIHHNTIRPTDDSNRCYGGGLSVTGGGYVTDSFIYCNTNMTARGSGGGVSVETSGILHGSTVSNNYSYGEGGGVLHVNYPSGGLRDCLIVDNTAAKSGGGGVGGPAATGCVFRRNKGSGGGGWLAGGAQGWFSNCVFEANMTTQWGEGKAAYIQRSGSSPFEFYNCWFRDHRVTDEKAILQFGGSPYPVYRARVRNCVFVGNTGASPFYSAYGDLTTGILAPELDNCTFVGPGGETRYAVATHGWKYETNVVARNCLFYGFKNGGLPPNIATYNPEHISNCYDQVSTTLPKKAGGALANNCLSGADVGVPRFYSLAQTNLTLKVTSPLLGKGLVLDWMKYSDGTPDPDARDAGRGTCEVLKAGNHGITIDFGHHHRRYEGGADAPDIGAYEHYIHTTGIVVR